MTKKQKKVLIRIIVSAVLLAGIMITTKLVEINKWIQLALYLVPYLIIGYDILKKAVKALVLREYLRVKSLMKISLWLLQPSVLLHSVNFPRVRQ